MSLHDDLVLLGAWKETLLGVAFLVALCFGLLLSMPRMYVYYMFFFNAISVMRAIWADWWWFLLMHQFLIDDTSKCGIWTKSLEFVLLLWCWRRLHTQFKEMHCWGIEFYYILWICCWSFTYNFTWITECMNIWTSYYALKFSWKPSSYLSHWKLLCLNFLSLLSGQKYMRYEQMNLENKSILKPSF